MHDLRSKAVPRQREISLKQKWQPKWAYGGVEAIKTDSSGTRHPRQRHSQRYALSFPVFDEVLTGASCQKSDRSVNEKVVRRLHQGRKIDRLGYDRSDRGGDGENVSLVDSGSSQASNSPRTSGEHHYDVESQPAPDADVMYSFDAKKGPSSGDEVFEHALTKAVEVFEDGQTTKLVKEQYDVVDRDHDSDGFEDEDFEIV
ncbi:MAG: hypothetical protein M1831_000468 [Alyxoria varia]|nr:MAG: hypothetical protein M1831_000468 [Alyxoria varia]